MPAPVPPPREWQSWKPWRQSQPAWNDQRRCEPSSVHMQLKFGVQDLARAHIIAPRAHVSPAQPKRSRPMHVSIDADEEEPTVPHRERLSTASLQQSMEHPSMDISGCPLTLPSASLRTTSSTESMSSAPSDLLNGSGRGKRREQKRSDRPLCYRVGGAAESEWTANIRMTA